MNVVILQPSYIPWRGYFHQIQKADLFIFYDDVQYDKHGWRNRNRIKTAQGSQWLTIPVHSKGVVDQNIPINQVKISWTTDWNEKHWRAIQQAYSKAPFFQQYAPLLEGFFQQKPEFLADFTIETTVSLARQLGFLKTQFLRSSQLKISGVKTDRLIQILKNVGATHYISGPSARDYIEKAKFDQAGIALEYIEYRYPEYPQLYPPFDQNVSIIDLLFMVGQDAQNYIVTER
jgi:hypothetical protein